MNLAERPTHRPVSSVIRARPIPGVTRRNNDQNGEIAGFFAANLRSVGFPPVSGMFNPDDELASESYDADGNATASGGKSFAYDTENRLVLMNGGAVSLVCDGGTRVAKTVSGVTTRYLAGDLNPTGYAQMVEELSGAGAVQRQYPYGLLSARPQRVLDVPLHFVDSVATDRGCAVWKSRLGS